jgi:sec-independent protein translocase protein TatB
MLDIGWFEMAVIGAVLLVVVGPKDLPKVLRTVGIWTGKARKMAREFQKALDEYAKDADLDGVKKAVETPLKAKKAVASALDPTGTLKKELTGVDSDLRKNLKETADSLSDKPETAAKVETDGAATERPAVKTPAAPAVAQQAEAEKPKVGAGGAS